MLDIHHLTSEERVIHEDCCGFIPEFLHPGPKLPLGLLLHILLDAFLGLPRGLPGPGAQAMETALAHSQEEWGVPHREPEQQVLEGLLDRSLGHHGEVEP